MIQHLREGSTLQGGKYTLLKVLGQGGFGITYLARQELMDRYVAVKEFFLKDYNVRNESDNGIHVSTEPQEELFTTYLAKFVKEARTLSRLEHFHIVRIYDVFLENDTAYYVMEHVEGESLFSMVDRRKSLSEQEALTFIREAGEALLYMHALNINHLDIKPSNIMYRQFDHHVLLIDFGLSKHYDELGHQTSMTPVGLSHGYSPSEQYYADGLKDFSPQTDIYALGATLYTLLTGLVPPEPNLVRKSGLPAFPDGISEKTRSAIRLAMQYHKEHRPQDVRLFLDSLPESVPELTEPAIESSMDKDLPLSSSKDDFTRPFLPTDFTQPLDLTSP